MPRNRESDRSDDLDKQVQLIAMYKICDVHDYDFALQRCGALRWGWGSELGSYKDSYNGSSGWKSAYKVRAHQEEPKLALWGGSSLCCAPLFKTDPAWKREVFLLLKALKRDYHISAVDSVLQGGYLLVSWIFFSHMGLLRSRHR